MLFTFGWAATSTRTKTNVCCFECRPAVAISVYVLTFLVLYDEYVRFHTTMWFGTVRMSDSCSSDQGPY